MLWAAPAAFMSKIIAVEASRTWPKTCAILGDCETDFASGVPSVIALSNSGVVMQMSYGAIESLGLAVPLAVTGHAWRNAEMAPASRDLFVCDQKAVIG
jgi:hypothetical protein